MQAIRELIWSQEAPGNWTLVFLGANVDAFTQETSLGMANSVRYDPANYRGAMQRWPRAPMRSQPVQHGPWVTFKGEAAVIKNS